MSGNTIQITPFLPVTDMRAALAFYTGTLGFAIYVQGGGYAYIARQGAAIRLLIHDLTDGPFKAATCYIDVHSLDDALAELQPAIDTLPKGRVHGPVNQAYYQRELFIRDPDGNLIIFGQGVGPNEIPWQNP